ncbi:MAG TPA: hypothetical protein VH763_20810 [Gemmatimonadales bacterium]
MRSDEDNGRYYSVLGGVHHILEDCPRGRLIPDDFKREGSGGLPLCPACRERVEAGQRQQAKRRARDQEPGSPL